MNPLLAAIRINGDGSGIVHTLLALLIVGLCILVVWWLGKYFLTEFGAPALAMKVWNGLFILLGGIFVINVLLSLVGHPLIDL